eukprot:TRINITY_DN5_c1_g1_i3.p3 TRINITY_DN5_c1_g1~~TRINITY_DN5_c1_g1_i3.p3  ORF type:complete len:109 (+),score=0.72 TRINITY_DN5_c1_g1_i3:1119-1445(+)
MPVHACAHQDVRWSSGTVAAFTAKISAMWPITRGIGSVRYGERALETLTTTQTPCIFSTRAQVVTIATQICLTRIEQNVQTRHMPYGPHTSPCAETHGTAQGAKPSLR